MSQASVLLDCINLLAIIYDIDLTQKDSSITVFNKPGLNGKGSDKKYFEYIRSLCSIHPSNTSKFGGMYHDNKGESCPFVVWDQPRVKGDCDLKAMVYSNEDHQKSRIVKIRMNNIFDYIKSRYEILDEIIEKIEGISQQHIKECINRVIKKPADFNNYEEYLDNLIKEAEERYPASSNYELEHARKIITTEVSDEMNKCVHLKYCNALKYAISFEHIRLQMMNTGTDNEMGILKNGDTILGELLHPNSNSNDRSSCSYEFSKIDQLIDPQCKDSLYAVRYNFINGPELFRKYVKINDDTPSDELFTLILTDLYMDCMENDCVLDEIIPHNKEYR